MLAFEKLIRDEQQTDRPILNDEQKLFKEYEINK